jgi:anti-anti-sigma factor
MSQRYLLNGDVDLASAPKVRADLKRLVREGDGPLDIDCSGLVFIDSQGIAVILEAHRDLAALGRDMRILNVPEQPQQAFHALGLSDLLEIERESA